MMTRDEILALEGGEELDALVAEKVMGWHIETKDVYKGELQSSDWKRWIDSEGHYAAGINRHDGWYEDDEDFNLINWHPSGSIMWAWEVVEKLMPLYQIEIEATNKMFKVSFDDYARTWEAIAEDAPVAICKAALLAVMEE